MSLSAARTLHWLVVAATLTLASPTLARPPDGEAVPPPRDPPCADVLRCQLPREIALTERFLRERKYGLPITLDPRPLTYALEVLRLNVMSQAMGYLNLYRATRSGLYQREAVDRLEYLLGLGNAALGNGPRDGILGYLLMDAYDLLGDPRYLAAGLRAATLCHRGASEVELSMNAGLMCALSNAYAARLTGDSIAAARAAQIVDRTAPKQFEDGAFPHLPFLVAGKNLSYSAWMANELLLLRDLAPEQELTEILLVRTIRFIQGRVMEDGSLSYSDSEGYYASDPGNADPRFWTSELASVALNLAASGHRDEAARCLRHLFGMRSRGEDLGGYPDKYANIDTTNVWETGRPSVLRTSLVFWYLTLVLRYGGPCEGAGGPCVAVGANCPPLYAQLGLCDRGFAGTRSCVGGRLTRCFDQANTAMRAGQLCSWAHACADEGADGACFYSCPVLGSRLCVGTACLERCQDLVEAHDLCERVCYPGQSCTRPRARAGAPVIAAQQVGASGPGREPAPFEVNSTVMGTGGRRENLSLQVLRTGRDHAATGMGASVELRLSHHGVVPVPAAELVLSRTDGSLLARRRLPLVAGRSLRLIVQIPGVDTLRARLDARPHLEEADTLDNLAQVAVEPAAESPRVDREPAASGGQAMPMLTILGNTRLVATLTTDAITDLGIYDIAGRCVRRLWRGPLEAGRHVFDWDLRTQDRGRAPPGVYFARLRASPEQSASRIVIVR